LGGEVFYQGTLEVTLPDVIPEQYGIRGALFVEAGGLGKLGGEFDTTPTVVSIPNPDPTSDQPFTVVTQIEDGLQLRASAGLSVFWDSPFGPIRFDFSQLITAPDFDRPRGIRFSTNTRF
jgi:outer membrane protein insertion porin family